MAGSATGAAGRLTPPQATPVPMLHAARMPVAPIPVTVVTGFLGAGKTTLLDAWLRGYARGEVAVIVNEIGAVGIDAELLGDRARALVEITGGCICCTTYGELVRALRELASADPAPRRIFVETSGAASPAGVLRAMTRTPELALDGVVTVVDASRVASLAASDLAMEQVGYADVVVLSRADVCDETMLRDARARLTQRNGAATIALAARGALEGLASLEALLAERSADLPRVLPSVHAARASGIESIALTHDGELDEDRFGAWMESELARFEGRLLRVKGVLAMEGVDERVILQGVADQVEVTIGAPWAEGPRASRMVIVGFGLDRDALEAGFARCAIKARATRSP